ncbi:MAG: hypothetical protein QNI86_06720 [Halieaceae bacterium]|nr:hypothetical protein [Halieaceae bacterium]
MRKSCCLFLVLILYLPFTLVEAEEVTRERAAELMEWCQRERAGKIAPLKEDAIEQCVKAQGWDRESCERRNENFGERRRGPDGMLPGMFWNSELCTKALNAERYFMQNPRAEVYTPG